MPDKPSVRLTGYTDGLGDEAHNRWLSRRRALAVRRVLIHEYGFRPASVDALGNGIRRPESRVAAPDDRIVVISVTK